MAEKPHDAVVKFDRPIGLRIEIDTATSRSSLGDSTAFFAYTRGPADNIAACNPIEAFCVRQQFTSTSKNSPKNAINQQPELKLLIVVA